MGPGIDAAAATPVGRPAINALNNG
jgi:hypothetical protein